jgi:hypothetical protein
MAFLDIKAAYDSVPRAELWRQCQDLGVDHLTLSTLRSLFDHNSAQLVVAQKRSKPFPLPAGVLQGSVLSPLLYSIYLDPLVAKLRTMGSRIRLPSKPVSEEINALMYADDIALIANSSRNLKRILELAEEDSIDRGYRFSPTKCVVVSQDNTRYRLYGTDLTKENSFCYLGVDINCLGICESAHKNLPNVLEEENDVTDVPCEIIVNNEDVILPDKLWDDERDATLNAIRLNTLTLKF